MAALGYVPLDDGYTETGTIAGVAGLHPDLTISRRPVLIDERTAYYQVAEKLTGTALNHHAATLIAGKLRSWDLKDHKGQPVPIEIVNAKRVQPKLFDALFAVLIGDKPFDRQPEQAPAELDGDLQDQVTAAQSGWTIAQAREARLRGNSPAPSSST